MKFFKSIPLKRNRYWDVKLKKCGSFYSTEYWLTLALTFSDLFGNIFIESAPLMLIFEGQERIKPICDKPVLKYGIFSRERSASIEANGIRTRHIWTIRRMRQNCLTTINSIVLNTSCNMW